MWAREAAVTINFAWDAQEQHFDLSTLADIEVYVLGFRQRLSLLNIIQ